MNEADLNNDGYVTWPEIVTALKLYLEKDNKKE
jgi:hypothetical protein